MDTKDADFQTSRARSYLLNGRHDFFSSTVAVSASDLPNPGYYLTRRSNCVLNRCEFWSNLRQTTCRRGLAACGPCHAKPSRGGGSTVPGKIATTKAGGTLVTFKRVTAASGFAADKPNYLATKRKINTHR